MNHYLEEIQDSGIFFKREKQKDKEVFIKEALMLHQVLSLCSSLVEENLRFESVRVLVLRLSNIGVGKKISLPEINAWINELLKQSIKSDGVINLFSDVKGEFSLFEPKFLEELSKMKEKKLVVELLKKLIADQVHIYRTLHLLHYSHDLGRLQNYLFDINQ